MNLKAVCFGEILWDIFPDKERIGGAPLNVASRLRASGIETDIISRVGNDQKGQYLLSYLETNKIGTKYISSDVRYPTGMVNVTLNAAGSATYDIAYPSAWDKIEFEVKMTEALSQADVFIFGSLACRDEISRKTLLQLLPHSSFKVFDLNLRPPHYEKHLLVELMESADFIKFNDEELLEIAHLLDSPYNSLEQNLEFISEKTNSKQICVTKGSQGAVLLMHNTMFYNSGYPVKVKDTVGAGDSFLASLISKLLKKEDPQAAIDYACAVGALVAAKEGANPVLKEETIRKFMSAE